MNSPGDATTRKTSKAKFQSVGTRRLIKISEENRDLNYFKYLHLCETVVTMREGMKKNKIGLITETV